MFWILLMLAALAVVFTKFGALLLIVKLIPWALGLGALLWLVTVVLLLFKRPR